MVVSALKRFFTPDPQRQQAHEAYVSIVAQSRQPAFFNQWQVPDTLDGRFDIILLHLSMVIARIEKESQDADAKHFVRMLSEVFFSDMDRSLRELGASDTGVGKRIKKMAQAFYGRLKAYGDALHAPNRDEALREAVIRNIYREKLPDDSAVAYWSGYCIRQSDALSAQPLAQVMAGEIRFIP